MKKKNLNREETVTMDEIRVFGYCECCGNKVTDADDAYYVNADGEVFCSCECCLEYYGVTKVEV
jgi:hypothetical protein